MVAIITATGQNSAFYGLDEYLPIPLLPLADRPFLQHVVEFLVRQGVRRFEFILSHLPEKIEARFGDGARWGCSFLYHLVPSADEALRVAAGIASGVDDDVILASGVCLPEFEMAAVAPVHCSFTRIIGRVGRGCQGIPACFGRWRPEGSKAAPDIRFPGA